MILINLVTFIHCMQTSLCLCEALWCNGTRPSGECPRCVCDTRMHFNQIRVADNESNNVSAVTGEAIGYHRHSSS